MAPSRKISAGVPSEIDYGWTVPIPVVIAT